MEEEETLKTKVLGNNLCVGPDWMSYTLPENMSVDEAVTMIGYQLDEFSIAKKGAQGYRSMIVHPSGITILFDGKPDMGIHMIAPGSAIGNLINVFIDSKTAMTPFGLGNPIWDKSEGIYELLKEIHLASGRFTRIDLAIDDHGERYFSIEKLEAILEQRQYVGRFKKYKVLVEKNIDGEIIGHTVYLGSRSSETMIRIYNKRAEQRKKTANNHQSNEPWVRWEIELKGKNANQAVKALIEKKDIGQVCIGVLARYFRVINLDNAVRSRCSVDKTWGEFLNGIEALRLSVPKEENSLNKIRQWLKKQVFPALAAVVMADGGSTEFIDENLPEAAKHLNEKYKKMIIAENPAYLTWKEKKDEN